MKTIRILGLSFLAFVLMFIYGVVRPASESLFLEAHTHESLPLVWIFVALGIAVAVEIYNRVLPRYDLLRLLGAACLLNAALLGALALAVKFTVPGSYYALYVWKDVHVIVLVEIYYAYANSVFPIKTARWAYGLFGAIAALAGAVGGIFVGKFALAFGTFASLWTSVPVFIISWLFCIWFAKVAGIGKPLEKKYKSAGVVKAISCVKKSSYLALVLLLILLFQVLSTLIDFQFNAAVESSYPAVDVRTEVIGKIYSLINFGTLVLSLLTGPVLRLLAVPATLISMPVLVGASVAAFVLNPVFVVVAAAKSMSKCFDYTLLRNAKEMLYIPLTYEERTLGKSIVDMFGHRTSKAVASFILMGLIAVHATGFVSWVALFLVAAWLVVTVAIVKRFRKKVSRRQEIEAA